MAKGGIPEKSADSLIRSTTGKREPVKPKQAAKKAAAPKTKPKKQAKDYDHFSVVSVSLYRPDIERLNELAATAKAIAMREGKKIPNKSDIIRLALSKLTEKDLSRL